MRTSLLLLLLISCSHDPLPPKDVVSFVEEWKSDYAPEDPQYVKNQEAYLYSVYKVLRANGASDKFDVYATTLKNNAQVLAHTEFALPTRYRKDRGRRPVLKSESYLWYKRKILSDLEKKQTQDRMEKLRVQLGDELYQKLIDNYQAFNQEHQTQNLKFPF